MRSQTRTEQLRDTYQAAIMDLIAAHAVDVGGDQLTAAALDGLRVVPVGKITDALAVLFGPDFPLPDRQDQATEVRTPARIVVDARCPGCGQTSTGTVFVTPELVTHYGGKREIKLKGKTAAIDHACGQSNMVDVTPDDDAVAGQITIQQLMEARCVAYTGEQRDGEELICDHFVSEHDAAEDGATIAADGSLIRPCEAVGCGCDDLRLADAGDLIQAPEPEAIETEGVPILCPWPGCVKPSRHVGRHSKANPE